MPESSRTPVLEPPPEMTLRAAAVAPPMSIESEPETTTCPAPFGARASPDALRPTRLPCTFVGDETVMSAMPAPPLPETTFPSPGPTPPMRPPANSAWIPSAPFGRAVLPSTASPTVFPWITAPSPASIQMPLPLLPEIRLPAPGAAAADRRHAERIREVDAVLGVRHGVVAVDVRSDAVSEDEVAGARP